MIHQVGPVECTMNVLPQLSDVLFVSNDQYSNMSASAEWNTAANGVIPLHVVVNAMVANLMTALKQWHVYQSCMAWHHDW